MEYEYDKEVDVKTGVSKVTNIVSMMCDSST